MADLDKMSKVLESGVVVLWFECSREFLLSEQSRHVRFVSSDSIAV